VTVVPGTFVRTGLLLLLTVVLELSGFSQMRILGGYIDLTPLLVAGIAIYAGSVPGAIVGFCTGLLIDLALGQNLGATSLVLTAVGYGVGRYRDLRDPAHGLLPLPPRP
jgi:rod shape-determining protein MreD